LRTNPHRTAHSHAPLRVREALRMGRAHSRALAGSVKLSLLPLHSQRNLRRMVVGYDVFISYSHGGDDLLSERVQTALGKFAKPWYRRRALKVFRDRTALAANPGLWTSISEAIDDSRYFLFLASPD